jgi:hypothetical protein
MNVANAPYTLSFSTSTAYNGGTGACASARVALPAGNRLLCAAVLTVRCYAAASAAAYKLGNMAWPSEVGNKFMIPVTGGAGPCPNGAMRSGSLSVTCGAAATSFNVVENPMCTYAMTYVTTQACPSPVPVSYFTNYQGMGVANAPYTLSFSTAKVYNGGTGACGPRRLCCQPAAV